MNVISKILFVITSQNLNIAIINLLLSLLVILSVIIIVAIIIISHIKDNLITLKTIGRDLGYIALQPKHFKLSKAM